MAKNNIQLRERCDLEDPEIDGHVVASVECLLNVIPPAISGSQIDILSGEIINGDPPPPGAYVLVRPLARTGDRPVGWPRPGWPCTLTGRTLQPRWSTPDPIGEER